eukprot:IDg18976t1
MVKKTDSHQRLMERSYAVKLLRSMFYKAENASHSETLDVKLTLRILLSARKKVKASYLAEIDQEIVENDLGSGLDFTLSPHSFNLLHLLGKRRHPESKKKMFSLAAVISAGIRKGYWMLK